jgi:large subunit ribosomal protein L6
MSKIGRKPISVSNVQVEVKGHELHYKGPKGSGVYVLPEELLAERVDSQLKLVVNKESEKVRNEPLREVNRIWGLNRALVANAIAGAATEFVKQIKITGLGYKGIIAGKKITFSLGYSHKIDFEIPDGVSVEADRTGQLLTLKSSNKVLVGSVVSKLEALKRTEAYKGTGVRDASRVITLKPGKTKSSS